MSLACSEDELKQLLDEVAFTRNFGFLLHQIADSQCSSTCLLSKHLSAREAS